MPNLLGEFLQEKQEPFSMKIYLLERGCSKRSNFLLRSAKILNTLGLTKRIHVIPNCSIFAKSVFRHLGPAKIKSNTKGARAFKRGRVFGSCHESGVENACCLFLEEEGDAERNVKWRCGEDNKQQQGSPVSVLQPITQSPEVRFSKVCSERSDFKREKQGKSSQCKLKQKMQHRIQEWKEMEGSNSYSQYTMNKMALKQTKQLMMDCVREVVEKYRKKDDAKLKILGSRDVWELVSDHVRRWSQESVRENNVDQVMRCDFLASEEEWRAEFEVDQRRIWMEIGDAILEDVIMGILTIFLA